MSTLSTNTSLVAHANTLCEYRDKDESVLYLSVWMTAADVAATPVRAINVHSRTASYVLRTDMVTWRLMAEHTFTVDVDMGERPTIPTLWLPVSSVQVQERIRQSANARQQAT